MSLRERVKPLTPKVPHGHLFYLSWSPYATAVQTALLWWYRKATLKSRGAKAIVKAADEALRDTLTDEDIYWAEKSCSQMHEVIGFYLKILRRWKAERKIETVKHHPRTRKFMDEKEKLAHKRLKSERRKAAMARKKKENG